MGLCYILEHVLFDFEFFRCVCIVRMLCLYCEYVVFAFNFSGLCLILNFLGLCLIFNFLGACVCIVSILCLI